MQATPTIHPKNIVDELNRLRELNSVNEPAKACLFNLIVYTHEANRTAYLKEVVKIIIEQFPCRVIFIQGNPHSKENELQVHVSTEKGSSDKGMSSDQIFIEVSGEDMAKVPFLLLPLYVPDLPIYLLWGQDPTSEDKILPHLQFLAKRLIFDSETIEDLQEFSQKLIERLDSHSVDVVDMNWARIGGWREVIAETFDTQARFDQLATAYSITLIYNNLTDEFFKNPHTQAIYLQAWLASRLNWEFVNVKMDNDTFLIYYQSPKGQHLIKLNPENHESFPPEEILAMDILGPKNYDCHLMRTDTNQVKVSAYNQDQCELPFTLIMPTINSGRSFMQEIFYQKVSEQYIPMLKLIRLIKWSP